jgi:hypothetical protein
MNGLGVVAFFSLFFLGGLVVLAVAALVVAVRANARAVSAEAEATRLAEEVGRLAVLVRRSTSPAVTPVKAPPPERAEAVPVVEAAPVEREVAPPPPAPVVAEAPAAPPVELAPPGPAAQPLVVPEEVVAAGPSLEERIGVTWVTRIGAAATVLGAAYFFKVAVERGWLGPWGRVLLAMLAGVGLIVAAERIRVRTDRRYVQALLGVGLALLYVASYAAYGFYRLVPLGVAFLGLAVVALFGGALAYRHRAEPVLFISLVAALANPVLLATGDDRSLALFAYLLVVTSAALAVSLARGFRVVPWVALAGSAVLYLDWHDEFYVDTAPVADEVTGERLGATAGPYWPMSARMVPLAAVAAFTAQWLAFGHLLRRRSASGQVTLAALIGGLLVFHGGVASLLSDRPIVLAAAMALGGSIAIAALRAPEERRWLAVPLAASFLVLAAQGQLTTSEAAPALLVAAVWIGLYLAPFAGAARAAADDRSTRVARAVLSVASAAVAVLAAIWLLPEHAVGFALAMVVVAAASAALAAVSRSGALPTLPAAASVLFLVVAAAPKPALGAGFLAFASLAAAIYLAAAAHAMLLRRDVSPAVALLGGGAAIGYVAVVISATATSAYGLRAILAALAGVAAFAVGALVLRRVPDGRNAATVLLTAGLALVTLAVGLAFSGVTITVAWSAMALVVVIVALRERDTRFVAAGVVLFGVALVRLLSVDVAEPQHAAARFIATSGAEGAFRAAPFLNPRSLGLAATGIALLLAARAVARRRDEVQGLDGLGAGFAGLGYTLLIALAITEATGLVTRLPAIPAGLAPEAFRVALAEASRAVAEQAARRAAAATLTLGLAGAALLAAGFAAKSLFHRWAGLLVLAVAIAKLGLWDIWSLPTALRVVVLLGLGALLLTVGFLYARFGRRLIGLLKVGGGLLLVTLAAPASAEVEASRYRHECVAAGVPAGIIRFEVTPALYRAAHDPGAFADLRILVEGREAPWTVRDVPAQVPVVRNPVGMFDPVVFPDGGSRADFEVGEGPMHAALELALHSAANYMRAVTVEVSDDRRTWGRIASSTVFRVRVGDATTSESMVRYPPSRSRWVRVSIAPVSGEQAVEIKGARIVGAGEARLPIGVVELGPPVRTAARTGRRSVFASGTGESGVPLIALLAEVADPRFERHVAVEGANADGVFVPVGSGVLLRAGRAENLRLPAHGTWARWRLVVDDGDDPPLEICSLRGEYRLQEVLFEAPVGGSARLLVGAARAVKPRYDLGATFARFPAEQAGSVIFGAPRANPDFRAGADAAPPRGWSERYRTAIGAAVLILLVGLGVAAARLLRSSAPAS